MSEVGRSNAVAAGVVMAVHLLAGWVLFRDPGPASTGTAPEPLRIRWVERPRPQSEPPIPSDVPPSPTTTASAPLPPRVSTTPAPARPGESAAPTASPRVDYLAQGTEWARQATPPPDFQPDLLASRPSRLPGGSGQERIRMKDPMTPAKVVGMIGILFGDPGDPCPRKRRNVDDSLTDTSPEGRRRLEWELREYREHCRP